MHRIAIIVLGVLIAATTAAVSMAGDSDTDKAIAEEKFFMGLEHARAERYEQARVYFEESLELYPTRNALFNLALVFKSQEKNIKALETIGSLKKKYGDELEEDMKSSIDNHVSELKEVVATLRVQVDQPETVIFIDGKEVSLSDENEIFLNPGVYDLELKLDGYETHHRTITAKGGVIRTESFAMTPIGGTNTAATNNAQTDTDATTDGPESQSASSLKNIGIGITVLGGAVMVSGAVTGGLALKKSNQLEENCPDRTNCDESNDELINKGQALEAATYGLIAAGAALATAGIVMTVIGNKKSKNESLAAFPVINERMAGLAIQGRF